MRIWVSFLMVIVPILGHRQGEGALLLPRPIQGIDVSHHQKHINWDQVNSQPYRPDFAFVKATEGADFTDSLFCYNWESLRRLGIRRGAYHFFHAYGCGYDQAIHFLQTVDFQEGDLAPVLDVEMTDDMPPQVMLEEVRIWLQTVEQRIGIKPIIYTNQNFYDKYLAGIFDNHPLWIARYSDEKPELISGKQWDFWQYSNEGDITGIDHHVDLNAFSGSEEALESLCWSANATKPNQAVAPAP